MTNFKLDTEAGLLACLFVVLVMGIADVIIWNIKVPRTNLTLSVWLASIIITWILTYTIVSIKNHTLKCK
jgi:hypothetical protein